MPTVLEEASHLTLSDFRSIGAAAIITIFVAKVFVSLAQLAITKGADMSMKIGEKLGYSTD